MAKYEVRPDLQLAKVYYIYEDTETTVRCVATFFDFALAVTTVELLNGNNNEQKELLELV